jgi:glucokinase-like ROK family protein
LDGNIWVTPNSHVKLLNKHVVLDLIRFTPGGVSRVDLSRQLGLTRAAVTSIINDLVDEGLVREAETRYSGGRRPIVLEVAPDKGYVLGVDLGATHLYVCLSDYSANIIQEREMEIDINEGPIVCLSLVDSLVQQVLEAAGFEFSDIAAVGIGLPGPVIIEKGTVSMPPIMPGWNNFPIRETLQQKWECPVLVNNDAELGALGEWAYGAGRGEKNLAYIKVGTGIGAGLIFESKIYHGTTGSAGEIGHITINENGPKCSCGNSGCLEAFAGGKAIASRAQEELRKGRRSQLVGLGDLYQISAKDVIKAAKRGDLLSQQIITETGSYLGIAIAGLVNLFNPSIVIIGGGISSSGDLLLDPIREAVANRSLYAAGNVVRISAALLGKRSTVMGAVTQALSYALHKSGKWNQNYIY